VQCEQDRLNVAKHRCEDSTLGVGCVSAALPLLRKLPGVKGRRSLRRSRANRRSVRTRTGKSPHGGALGHKAGRRSASLHGRSREPQTVHVLWRHPQHAHSTCLQRRPQLSFAPTPSNTIGRHRQLLGLAAHVAPQGHPHLID
jgi:hypothetical protein